VHRDGDPVTAQLVQPPEQHCGRERVVGVAVVEPAQVLAGQAVRTNQHAIGTQHPDQFGEHPLLVVTGRDVMQHRERTCRIENRVIERQLRGVDRHHLDVGAGEALGQPRRGGRVGLGRDEPAHPVP